MTEFWKPDQQPQYRDDWTRDEPHATETATWWHVAYFVLVVGGAIVAGMVFGQWP